MKVQIGGIYSHKDTNQRITIIDYLEDKLARPKPYRAEFSGGAFMYLNEDEFEALTNEPPEAPKEAPKEIYVALSGEVGESPVFKNLRLDQPIADLMDVLKEHRCDMPRFIHEETSMAIATPRSPSNPYGDY